MKSSLSHVALLVPSVEKSAAFLATKGISSEEPENFPGEGTKEIYVGRYDQLGALLLLVEPIGTGPYQRAMQKRGPSLHHIAVDVLNLEEYVSNATALGWQLHPVSQKSIPDYQTAWFFHKDIPTLIEVSQRKTLSANPYKISKIELPIGLGLMTLFDVFGLNEVVSRSDLMSLTIEGRSLTLDQIALHE